MFFPLYFNIVQAVAKLLQPWKCIGRILTEAFSKKFIYLSLAKKLNLSCSFVQQLLFTLFKVFTYLLSLVYYILLYDIITN